MRKLYKSETVKAARWSMVVLGALVAQSAWAKRFQNAYVSFELPPSWECKLEGAEWVCENTYSKKQKEAIIILTAKEVGPADTMANYMAHLQTPRVLPGANGAAGKSKILHVQQRTIANQLWIDGMHEGSEVTAYFTRYMATIKDRIAILVTFSAHKEHYDKYANDFVKAIESIRVVAAKDILADHSGSGPGGNGAGGVIGTGAGSVIPFNEGDGGGGPDDARANASKKAKKIAALALLAAAGGGYLFWMSRKPKKKKK